MYILDSSCVTGTTIQECYLDDVIAEITSYNEPSPSIPKFYKLNMKKPFEPQFQEIMENVKLLITFS
jgi:hypothetical protein